MKRYIRSNSRRTRIVSSFQNDNYRWDKNNVAPENVVVDTIYEVINYIENRLHKEGELHISNIKQGKVYDDEVDYQYTIEDSEGRKFTDTVSLMSWDGEDWYNPSESYDVSDQLAGVFEDYCDKLGISWEDYNDEEW